VPPAVTAAAAAMVQPSGLKRVLQAIVVAALTVLLLALFLRNADLRDVGGVIRRANFGWLALGFAANLGALVCRTLRWRTILDPKSPPPFYATFFANAVGYSLSTILPIRAGDVARPALLSRRTGIKFSTALGTVLTEKLFDLFAILSLFILFVLTSGRLLSSDPLTSRKFLVVQSAAVTAGLALTGMLVLVVLLLFFRNSARVAHEFMGRVLPRRFRQGWMRFFDSFIRSLSLTRHSGALPRVILLTGGIWMCIASQFFFVFLSLGRPLPFTASFFISGATILGLMIPTPGGVGGVHKAAQTVLVNFYHFDVNLSVAASLLVHVVGVLPVLVTGTTLVLKEGMTWRQLSHISEEVEKIDE
jgi:glycosyltransferase 2 family protein